VKDDFPGTAEKP